MNKPKFDPNQKFDIVQDEKPKFDPNAHFESLDEPRTTAMDAFHKNASDSALLGYGPQVRAGVIDPLVEGVGNFFTGDDVDMGNYVANRDAYRKEIEQTQKEHPGAALAGSLTGAAATSLIPGLNAAKGATAGARIINAAKTGAAMGALMNPGDKAGEYSGAQFGDRIKNAAIGGVTSGVLQGAGEGVSRSVEKGGKFLKDLAEQTAFKSNGAMLKDFRNATDRGKINEVGRYMLDNGLGVGDSVGSVADKFGKRNEAAGKSLDDIYNQAGAIFKEKMNGSGFDPIRDKSEILQAAKNELGDAVGAKGALEKLSSYLDDVATRHGDDPMQSAMQKYSSDVSDYLPKQKQFLKDKKSYQSALGKAGEDLNQPVLPGIADDFQRTGSAPRQIELGGQDPSLMRSETSDLNHQMGLKPLPQRGGEPFNTMRGDDLLPFQQQMALDDMSSQDILKLARQGNIEGTDLIPRTFKTVDDTAISNGKGQMGFPIAPEAPVRPVRPEDIRNPMSPRGANDIKSALDEAINYSRNPLTKEPAAETAYSAARTKINQKNLDAIESLGGGELADQLRGANKEYGLSKQVSQLAQDRVNRNDANRMFGLTDMIAGGAALGYGAKTDDWEGAGGMMLAKKGLEKYGLAASAVALDKISKTLMNSPRFAQMAQTNPKAFATMVQALSNNPKFQSAPAGPAPQKMPLLDRMSADPSKMDVLQNDRLKDQLKKQMERRRLKGKVPIQEAQASFVQGN